MVEVITVGNGRKKIRHEPWLAVLLLPVFLRVKHVNAGVNPLRGEGGLSKAVKGASYNVGFKTLTISFVISID